MQKISFQSIFIEPPMPALTEASSFIATHYSSGIHTFNIVWTMLIHRQSNVLTFNDMPATEM